MVIKNDNEDKVIALHFHISTFHIYNDITIILQPFILTMILKWYYNNEIIFLFFWWSVPIDQKSACSESNNASNLKTSPCIAFFDVFLFSTLLHYNKITLSWVDVKSLGCKQMISKGCKRSISVQLCKLSIQHKHIWKINKWIIE